MVPVIEVLDFNVTRQDGRTPIGRATAPIDGHVYVAVDLIVGRAITTTTTTRLPDGTTTTTSKPPSPSTDEAVVRLRNLSSPSDEAVSYISEDGTSVVAQVYANVGDVLELRVTDVADPDSTTDNPDLAVWTNRVTGLQSTRELHGIGASNESTAPTGLQLSGFEADELTATWSAPSEAPAGYDDPSGYRIEITSPGVAPSYQTAATAPATIADLEELTSYTIRVQAQWDTGEDTVSGAWSSPATRTTGSADPIVAPTNTTPPTATASSTPVRPGTTITVGGDEWDAGGAGSLDVEYQFQEWGGAGTVYQAWSPSPAFEVADGLEGIEVAARARATNAAGATIVDATPRFVVEADPGASWGPVSPATSTRAPGATVFVTSILTDGGGWATTFMRSIDGVVSVAEAIGPAVSDDPTQYGRTPTVPEGASTVEYWWRAELDGTIVDSAHAVVTVSSDPVPVFSGLSPTSAVGEEGDEISISADMTNAEGWDLSGGWSTTADVAGFVAEFTTPVPTDSIHNVSGPNEIPASTAGSTIHWYYRLQKAGFATIWSDPCVVAVAGGAAPGTPDVAEIVTDDIVTAVTTHSYALSSMTIAAGDYLFAAVYTSTDAVSAPSGWTELGGLNLFGSGGNLNFRLLGRVADGSETSMVFSTGASARSSARIHRLTGVSTTQPPAIAVSPVGFGLELDPATASAGWGAADNTAIAGFVAGNSGATLTGSAGYSDAGATDAANQGTIGSGWASFATATYNPPPFTISDGTEGENYATWSALFAPSTVTGGGTPPPTGDVPTIPTFSQDVLVAAGQDLAALTESNPAGTHFYVQAGAIIDDVRAKTDNHYRLAAGAVWDGSGKGYAFRPETATSDGVVIEGDPGGSRPQFINYGNGTSRQDYGAIMGTTNDPLAGQYLYLDVADWTIARLDLESNASNGIKLGSNFTVYDCRSAYHTVTGINGDRIVGGWISTCELVGNATNPATGAYSNGANIKVAWVNANEGRTVVMSTSRPKAQFRITDCELSDCKIGIWFDLDCQNTLVERNTLTDHPSTAIFHEGSNGGEVRFNTIYNSDGYGPADGTNFRNGALCAGESTNIWFHHNELHGCNYALMNRMSNRSSDWYNASGSTVAYAWPSGDRYWIKTTSAIPAEGATANMWTGNNRFEDNVLIDCNRIVINEGDNSGGMTTQGATPIGTITFARNDYSQSPGIQFYDRSNTALHLAQWRSGSPARASDGA